MPTIRCTVSSCHFWDDGNYCGADEILVEPNPRKRSAEMEAASLGDMGEPEDSRETMCKTFRPRHRR